MIQKALFSLSLYLVTKSCLTLATPWTVACQAPLSMGFSRQEYWTGLPFPSPGDLPDPGIEPRSPALQADSLPYELWGTESPLPSFHFLHFCVFEPVLPYATPTQASGCYWFSHRNFNHSLQNSSFSPEAAATAEQVGRWSCVQGCSVTSRVWLFVTLWTVVLQAPPSIGFPRQEYWGRLPFPSPRDLPDPGIESESTALQANSSRSEPPEKPWG